MAEKITALYARFSHDDGCDNDSDSIIHQKEMLTDYAYSHGFTNCRYYADDGYTGLNCERPDFKRMIADIEFGLVETVIVKDLSRLGRNYLLIGQYTEIVFPAHEVRFIAINDNVDSADGISELMPFSNLINEWYSRDISKKTRAYFQQKGKSGKRLTTRPIYGYKLDPENREKWVIDEPAAAVVRRIFEMYLSGYGILAIAKALREDKILKPNVYLHYAHDEKGVPDYQYEWCCSTVSTFLLKPEYCGDTVNFKTNKISYKSRKTVENPPEKWAVFLNTHPAIIDRETFAKAQEIYKNRYRKHPKVSDNSLFFGYLYCLDCKQRMHISSHLKRKRKTVYYECATYRKKIKAKLCFLHSISYDEIETYVTTQLIRLFYMANHDMSALKAMVSNSLCKAETTALKEIRDELADAQHRVEEINKYVQNLFESKVKGEIDPEIFSNLSKAYLDEKTELNEKIASLIVAETNTKEKVKKFNNFYTAIAKHGDFHELTPELMRDLIDRIEIGALITDPKTGEKSRIINIYYIGVGILRFD